MNLHYSNCFSPDFTLKINVQKSTSVANPLCLILLTLSLHAKAEHTDWKYVVKAEEYEQIPQRIRSFKTFKSMSCED